MSNPFGGFVHRSPLSSVSSHSPMEDVASNCIRDFFGPTCQTVIDCLVSRGDGTLQQILARIRQLCRRDVNDERHRLVSKQLRSSSMNKARGSEQDGFIVNANPIRAALIVLLHHGIVVCRNPTNNNISKNINNNIDESTTYIYQLDLKRARFLPRYPRYVEYAKKALDDNAAALVEELLVHGRLRTEDAIKSAMESVTRTLLANKDDDEDENEEDEENPRPKNEELDAAELKELREGVVKSFKRLIDGGYVEMAKPIPVLSQPTSNNQTNSNKKRTHDQMMIMSAPLSYGEEHDEKKQETEDQANSNNNEEEMDSNEFDDAEIVALLKTTHSYRRTFIRGAVWRVNVIMFHDTMRALCLGRLVSERYGDKVQFAGSFVTAALKVAAHKEHALMSYKERQAASANNNGTNDKKKNGNINNDVSMIEQDRQRLQEEKGVFAPDDLLDYLPPKILHELKNKAGGARSNISSSLVALCSYGWPQVLMEVEEARGHPLGGKFEIATRQLVGHLRGRALHQIVLDDMGDTAARICAILETRGYLESEAIADSAMIPIQDAREVIHRLYRNNYISILNLQQSKQHNPGNAIYLWGVNKVQMNANLKNKMYRAMYNLRLRRQHEVQVGKEWIERAKEAGATDENEHQQDKLNYQKFCQGLERLDNALLQIDETIMLLDDF